MARVSIDIKTALDSSGINKARDDMAKLSQAADREASKISQHFDKAGQNMQSAGKKMSLGVTAPLAALGFQAFQNANQVDEALNKVNVVFGQSGKAVDDWAKGAAKNLGLSRESALSAAGSFGNMFVQLGIGQQEAQKMSQNIVGLSADFASFHNADISEVITAQSAAFRGEYDALQRFLPLINAATVEQQAMAMTGKKNVAELTAQEKALAVNALMASGAGDAMGDFARTADGAANKQRILAAEASNVSASFGDKLKPMTDKVLEVLGKLSERFSNLSPETQDIIVKVGLLAAAIGPVLLVGGKAITMFVDVGRGFKALSAILAANPWVLLIAATVALVMIIIKNWDTIKAALGKAWDWLKDKAGAVWDGIKGAFKAGVNAVIGYLNFQIGAVEKIINALVKAYNLLADIPGNPLDTIKAVSLPRIPQLAEGGTILSPGAALVGERGPELLNLPRGAMVEPLARLQGGGYRTANITLEINGRQLVRAIGVDLFDEIRSVTGLRI